MVLSKSVHRQKKSKFVFYIEQLKCGGDNSVYGLSGSLEVALDVYEWYKLLAHHRETFLASLS